jgi:hypothetical protein
MIDPSYSRQKAQEENAAALARWRRLIILTVAGLIFIGAGLSIVWGFGGTRMAAPSPPVREQASNELVETTKALRETQQQAVDQLQVVQDQLLAQQAETKKLSESITALTEKVDTLQQSIANILALPFGTPRERPLRNSYRKDESPRPFS